MNQQPPAIGQVGAHYAVKDYIRRIRLAADIPRDDQRHWMGLASRMTDRVMPRDAADRIVDHMINGPTAAGLLSLTRTQTRHLGKPCTVLETLVAEDLDVVRTGGEEHDRDDQWISVARQQITIKSDRVEMREVPTCFSITQHALERIHQREHCPTAGIDAEMIERIVGTDGHLAFVEQTGLYAKGDTHPLDGFRAGTAFIPFGNGIAIAERQRFHEGVIAKEGLHGRVRTTIRHGRINERRESYNEDYALIRPHGDRSLILGRSWVIKTYISENLIRPGQRAYLDDLYEATKGVDLKAIAHGHWASREQRLSSAVTRASIDADRRRDMLTALYTETRRPITDSGCWVDARAMTEHVAIRDGLKWTPQHMRKAA